MTSIEIRSIVEALRAATARRIDLSDDIDKSFLIIRRFELAALETYDEALTGLDGKAALEWLVGRMARIEASVVALQAALGRPLGRPGEGTDQERAPGPAETAPGQEEVSAESAEDIFVAAAAELETLYEPARVSVDLDDAVVQSGFYHRERNSAGASFRWLGPEPVGSVYLPSIEGPVRVAIRAMKVFDGVSPQEVRVSVDGGEWAGVSAEKIDGVLTLTAEPKRGPTGAAATTRVDIDCIRTISPLESGVNDERQLGIAIYGVDLTRIEKGEA